MTGDVTIPAGAVLVGYDGSVDSDLALSWADEVARDTQRPLCVLISEVDPTQVLEMTAEWHTARIARIEADARDRIKESRAPFTSVDVVSVPPTAALIDASARGSLLVVGARGHTLLSGVVLGSVSQHLARHAACPVVVVRQPHDPQPRVVVGVDGSAASRQALDFAAPQADRTGSSLTVVNGWRSLSHGRGALPGSTFERRYAEEVDAAERLLAESVAGLAETWPDLAVTTEAIPVPPGRCLADASQAASLVVVGSRGRGAFAGMLLGSVGQSVLHQAHCPVAVVR